MALSRSLYGKVCGAPIVAVEQIVETWQANHGVVHKDEQLFFVVTPLSANFPDELQMQAYY